MRREGREIVGRKDIASVIRKATVCHLAICDGGSPYAVPLCFGYDDGTLYFHSARKLEALRRNDRVCFEISVDHEIMTSGDPCHWDMRYKSVTGFGRASFVEDLTRSADNASSFDTPEDTSEIYSFINFGVLLENNP